MQRCNLAFAQLFGAGEPAQLAGRAFAEFHPDAEDAKALRREVNVRLKAGKVVEAEREMQRLDGSRFWARLVGRALSMGDGDEGHDYEIWAVVDIGLEREAKQRARE